MSWAFSLLLPFRSRRGLLDGLDWVLLVTPGSSSGLRSAFADGLGGLSESPGPALRDLAGR